jgi:hypothetical protein
VVSRLLDTSVARRFVPAKAHVVSVMPGKTLAMLYCARYQRGSSLIYSELALAPALVRVGGRAGFWISHIYVDDPLSVAGGREIWHLPKQIAAFEWSTDAAQVSVMQGGLTLCRVARQGRAAPQQRTSHFPLPLIAPVVIEQPTGFRVFWLRGACRLARWRCEISADPVSPLAQLRLTGRQRVLSAEALSLTVFAPGE